MKILALETSAKSVSAAVLANGEVAAYAYQNTGLTHSRTLMPLVDGMLKNAGLAKEELNLIAVAAGPGSFTGLRIGVSAAKGLAWALDLPCCAVSTLEAMARNLSCAEGTVACAMDARRDQVYNAVFTACGGALERCTPDRAIGLDQLAEELRGRSAALYVVGDGAALCAAGLSQRGVPCTLAPAPLRMQNAVGVALVAQEMAVRGKTVSAAELTPNYLRLSQAERERLARGLPLTADGSGR